MATIFGELRVTCEGLRERRTLHGVACGEYLARGDVRQVAFAAWLPHSD